MGGAAETLEEDSDFEFLNNFKGAAQILECGDEVIKSVGECEASLAYEILFYFS